MTTEFPHPSRVTVSGEHAVTGLLPVCPEPGCFYAGEHTGEHLFERTLMQEVEEIERLAREEPLPRERAHRIYRRIGTALGWTDEQTDKVIADADAAAEAVGGRPESNLTLITCYRGDVIVAEAEADSAEGMLLACRTLWDEAWTGVQGIQRRLVVTDPDGQVTQHTVRP